MPEFIDDIKKIIEENLPKQTVDVLHVQLGKLKEYEERIIPELKKQLEFLKEENAKLSEFKNKESELLKLNKELDDTVEKIKKREDDLKYREDTLEFKEAKIKLKMMEENYSNLYDLNSIIFRNNVVRKNVIESVSTLGHNTPQGWDEGTTKNINKSEEITDE